MARSFSNSVNTFGFFFRLLSALPPAPFRSHFTLESLVPGKQRHRLGALHVEHHSVFGLRYTAAEESPPTRTALSVPSRRDILRDSHCNCDAIPPCVFFFLFLCGGDWLHLYALLLLSLSRKPCETHEAVSVEKRCHRDCRLSACAPRRSARCSRRKVGRQAGPLDEEKAVTQKHVRHWHARLGPQKKRTHAHTLASF